MITHEQFYHYNVKQEVQKCMKKGIDEQEGNKYCKSEYVFFYVHVFTSMMSYINTIGLKHKLGIS